jgi:hypothetical protein
VDALTSLLDKTCGWLGEDEHRRAEVALRRLGPWVSDSPSDTEQAHEDNLDTTTKEVVAVGPSSGPAVDASTGRRLVKTVSTKRRARSPVTTRRTRTRNGNA